jgi:hypothetical protein
MIFVASDYQELIAANSSHIMNKRTGNSPKKTGTASKGD